MVLTRNSGESHVVAEHAPNLKPPRSLWARRFSAARTVDSLHSLHSLARHIVEWAKSPNRSGRRCAAIVIPAREGEVAEMAMPENFARLRIAALRNFCVRWRFMCHSHGEI